MQSQIFALLISVRWLCSYIICYLIMRKEIPTTINGNVPFTKIRFIFNYLSYSVCSKKPTQSVLSALFAECNVYKILFISNKQNIISLM